MDTTVNNQHQSSIVPMSIIGLLFFIFGFVTWLNGALMPFLKLICNLEHDWQAFLVTFAFYIAYTVMAFPMSFVLKKTGYKNGMALGLGIMVIGALMFIPAAYSREYMVFLVALFVLGTGLTILQTASNPYVVLIGPKESAAMRISIMGFINKAAGVIVPAVFVGIVLHGLDNSPEALEKLTETEIQGLSERLVMPYLYMAAALLVLVGIVKYSGLPEIATEEDNETEEKTNIFTFPQVVLGAVAIFAYVGIEVIAGDAIGLLGEKLGIENFAGLTSYTMFCMVIGYVIGIVAIPRFLSQQKALLGSAIAGILCVVGVVFSSPESTVIADILYGWTNTAAVVPDPIMFVALMGLAHALVWPAVWPLALDGLGKYTAQGSALLIMGIAGGAILPLVLGGVSDALDGNLQTAFWVGLPIYLYILYYAVSGHKKRSW